MCDRWLKMHQKKNLRENLETKWKKAKALKTKQTATTTMPTHSYRLFTMLLDDSALLSLNKLLASVWAKLYHIINMVNNSTFERKQKRTK